MHNWSAGIHQNVAGCSSVQCDPAVFDLKNQVPGQFGHDGNLVARDETKLNQMLTDILAAFDFFDDDRVTCLR